jgi:YjbE family integral membrane protein
MDLMQPEVWLSIGQIVLIDILLGGDNAVVIALACRNLPSHLRTRGIFWGMVGAVMARAVLVTFALQLLEVPVLKLVGALLLVWIGVKLMLPDDGSEHDGLHGGTTLWSAVRTVVIADVVMSLDNVIAVSASADGHLGLVLFGIALSIPIIVWGSRLVLAIIDRYPVVVVFGACLLGWIAGGLAIGDDLFATARTTWPAWTGLACSVAGAALVYLLGTWRARAAQRDRHSTLQLTSK